MGVHTNRARRCIAGLLLMVMSMSGGVPSAGAAAVTRTVTLAGPVRVEANVPTTYTGRLAVDNIGVPNEKVTVLVGGAPAATAVTGLDGTYSAAVTFAQFGLVQVRAAAYRGTPLEIQSAILNVTVPSYDDTAAPTLFQATKFLYTGPNAVQTGVDLAALDPAATAVLRGSVTTAAGAPLSGVEVRVVGHDEFGVTTTGAGGGLDMVVNGGQPLVVEYQKPGYIPVQREVTPSWRDYEAVPDVAMTPYDPIVTTVNLSSTAMQVVQGSESSDADGERQSTLLFPPSVDAVMTLADGTVQPLDSLSVRATEFTVGDAGAQAMPGDLPAESGYTYAVEFSADEAIAAGATTVHFTEPVINYVENFLEFPVGTPVPTGYYDREKGAWSASGDGMVIGVTALIDGMAEIDVDGDGLADGAAELAPFGITHTERTKLATLYLPGQSLWRVPIPHFTPWDHNFPYGLPGDAEAPGQDLADSSASSTQCTQAGSIIGCENQTLGEAIPLAGTPFHLRYDSGRAPGRVAERSLEIPLTGAAPPASLKQVTLMVTVAGQTFSQSFTAAPNLQHMFVWDGLDAYGRRVQGTQTAKVSLGYVYDAVYYGPAAFGASFGRAGGAPIVGSRARREITVLQEYEAPLGGLFDKGLQGIGGWMLSAHHAYDPEGRVLQLGTGERRGIDAMSPAISVLAGNGQAGGNGEGTYTGDGGRAAQAGLGFARGITVAPDGSLYIADTGNGVVRRVTREGIITTFAGGGSPATGNGDGGPATSARLITPTDVAVGSDGSVYISDPGAGRIRRVDAGGDITTFAGGGTPADGIGDGGQATSAKLPSPRGLALGGGGALYVTDAVQKRVRRVNADGTITTVAGGGAPADLLGDGLPGPQAALSLPLGVAVDTAGRVYIADASQHRIRVVGKDGIIGTFAGTGVYGYNGDGGQATAARIGHPVGVAVDPTDDSVYFVQRFHHRIRKVAADGVIATAAGTGADGRSGDLGPPIRATLHEPNDVAIDPDGVLYIADTDNFQIRRAMPPLPGFGIADFLVPSEDGAELYQFDSNGRHLRTLDGLTNVPIYTFHRDGRGLLWKIEDAFGNVTTVERDSAGVPSEILSPFGARTVLAVNAEGYLATITNPANEVVTLGYGDGGLLTSLVTPRNAEYTFSYDALGRLLVDEGPDGNSTTLSRLATPTGFRVTSTSAEGRVTTYEIEELPDGSRRRTVTHPSGVTDVVTARTDGSSTTMTSDGASSSATLAPDPRWGMLAPLAATATTTLPSGLTVTTTRARTVSLGDPTNLLSLQSQTDTATTNGAVTTTVYNAGARTITTTTPGGRSEKQTLDARGLVIRNEPGALATTEYSYDSRGRPTAMMAGTGTDARVTSYEYGSDGMVSAITDARDDRATFERDPVGRVTASTLPGNHRPTYGYDAAGNLTALTPPGKPVHAFDYTPGDLMSAYRPPDGSAPLATTFTHNLDLQPEQVAMPDGRTVTYGYDGSGRPESSAFSRGQITTGYNGASQVAQLTAPGGETIQFGYSGNLPTQVSVGGTVTGQVVYGYGANFQRSARTVSGGAAKAFLYDNDGFPTSAGALSLAWHPANGYLTGTSLGGVTTSHGYNAFGESTSVSGSHGATGLYAASYERDDLGRISRKTETVEGVTHSYDYVYDDRGQLDQVSVDGAVARTYAYDGNGNRTGVTEGAVSTGATYDDQDRMLARGASAYTYTPAGDLATKTDGAGPTTYAYDEMGNLVEVLLPTSTAVAYVIDGMNRRIAKSLNGVVVRRWLYGDGPAPVAEVDATGGVIAEYVYASRPNVPDFIVKGGVTYRVLSDSVGSPRLIVDAATGSVAQRIDYDEYGNVVADSNPGFQPFGFAGGLYDVDTGLVRFGARDYDPAAGRWTARDPIGFESGTNLYQYGGNDPVNNVDPSGLDWVQNVGDFSAGFGDTVSFGITRRIRQSMGVDNAVGYCSGFYTGGSYTSMAVDLATGVKGAASVAKWGARGTRARGATRLADDVLEYGGTPKGRPYTKHYGVERGPERKLPGSVVDEAIDHYPGKTVEGGKTVYYDPNNNVTVVTGDGGAIVSARRGPPPRGQR